MLAVHGLTRRFGGVLALDGLTMQVWPGETLGVIGPNGAGKSTLIELVAGALTPTSGLMRMGGVDIARLPPPARSRLGIGRTHQIPRPFGRMTVLENLVLAARHARGPSESVGATMQRCHEILQRTGLAEVADALAGGLPLLRRKRMELARALALRPRLLLLDEIGAGLVEHEIEELIDLVRRVREEVEAIVLIEHVMEVITSCCDRAVVLDFGRLVATGPTHEVLADPEVAAIYLGTSSRASAAKGGAAEPEPEEEFPDRNVTSSVHSADSRPLGRPLLTLRDVQVSYGGVRALRGVNLAVHSGEVVALLGANGAGKTTIANAISGAVPLSAGSIHLDGRRVDGTASDEITAHGIAHCMEGRRIFSTLTVEENLLLAAGPVPMAEAKRRLRPVYQLFPTLEERREHPGTAMSGGQQQMLAIGRALMSAPRLIIFDEISLGLAPITVDLLYEALDAIRGIGVSMLLVEQNLERGLTLADRAYVLANGQVALSGTADYVRSHPTLRSLYVGESTRRGW